MLFPILCFVGGLMAMGRTKPITAVHKILCLGPRSGIVYQVEDFREIGTVIVRAPNKRATAQFVRAGMREPGKPGLVWQHGIGDPALLAAIRADFGTPETKLSSVKGGQSEEKKEKEKTS